MSAADPRLATSSHEKPYEEVRKAWHAAHVRPLWESPVAHRSRAGGPRAHLWQWRGVGSPGGGPLKGTTPAAGGRPALRPRHPPGSNPPAGTTTHPPTPPPGLLPG